MIANRPGKTMLRRILVVKLADMGDALLSTPALRALDETFPDAEIDVLVTPLAAQILRLSPHVDHLIPMGKYEFDSPSGLLRPRAAWSLASLATRLRLRRYDAVVLLHHLTTRFGAAKFRALCVATGAPIRAGLDNGRGEFLTHRAIDLGFGALSEVEYALEVAGTLRATTSDRQPTIQIPAAARESAARLLASEGIREPFAVIHPSVGAYSTARAWHPERFGEVARAVHAETGIPAVLVGAGDASEAARVIEGCASVTSLIGKTSVPELAAILSRAQLVICSDSGVAHLANAVGRPVIAVFGPSNHQAWGPYGYREVSPGEIPASNPSTVVIRSAIPCSPCFYTGYALGRRNGCRLRTCLDLVDARSVTQIATQILRSESSPN